LGPIGLLQTTISVALGCVHLEWVYILYSRVSRPPIDFPDVSDEFAVGTKHTEDIVDAVTLNLIYEIIY